jgi:hypothetical protein
LISRRNDPRSEQARATFALSGPAISGAG